MEEAVHAGADNTSAMLALEAFIASKEVERARSQLRKLLIGASEAASGSTIGEALIALSKQTGRHRAATALLLRSLAVQGLMPAPNATNQIIRSTVTLCTSSVPEIISFLRIDDRQQNIDVFNALAGCHGRIIELLSPLRVPHADLTSLLAARGEILGCLNHSIVRSYAAVFGLKEVRATAEAVLGKLRRISETQLTLLVDIDDLRQTVQLARGEISTLQTWLTVDYLAPFLATAETAVSDYLSTLRGRFNTDVVPAEASGTLQKRYPLHEVEHTVQVVIPLRNAGPGLATDLEITPTTSEENLLIDSKTVNLGNVLPGTFSVVIDVMIVAPVSDFTMALLIEWGEIGSHNKKGAVFEFKILAQASNVDWKSLQYQAPYSTEVAEGERFVGRRDKVEQLAAKLLRTPMESFYITGQKRVGKTSLALAALDAATTRSGGLISYHYVLWGSVAHADANVSLQRLGESIEMFMQRCLPSDLVLPKGDYSGSLADLTRAAAVVQQFAPARKLVLLLDEFDEIHSELFVQGNLAETFFANLRALSRCKNVCVVLVGGENMPFVMDRQGQKLNNFQRENLSYFSRTAEWSDFHLMVSRPTDQILNWHEDAISEVFNITNGNPYFANIVCASVFRRAVFERDADITAKEVKRAVDQEISHLGANSFSHLWQDGIPKSPAEREPDVLRRMRVLVAIARCMRKPASKTNTEAVAANKTSPQLSSSEIPIVLNDFVRREVLLELNGDYEFSLPIFQLWLVDVGISQLFMDALNEELANVVYAHENEALVRSEEVAELARGWPTYRGRQIGTDDIKAWYQQVDSLRDQRVLFQLLRRTRVFSEAHIRERLKSAHQIVRTSGLPEFVIRKRTDRRKDIIVTYVDGEGKSGANYASTYAEENGIWSGCVLPKSDFSSRFSALVEQNGPPAVVVLVDDLAATGNSLVDNLDTFLRLSPERLHNVPIRIITLVATTQAQERIESFLRAEFGERDVRFSTCELLQPDQFAFPENHAVWKTRDDEERARALCTDLGSRIYQNNPMGFGDLGILLVFPTTVPNNTLPILHSPSRSSSHKRWVPLFPRVVN